MTVSELLDTLREKGIEFAAVDGRLRLRGNKQALNDSGLLLELQANKAALLDLLNQGGYAGTSGGRVHVPPNRIPIGCRAITPEMLPLVSLTQNEIDDVVATVRGGVANVQDIYPLAPLQEGLFFHHLMRGHGDLYLTTVLFGCDNRERLDRYLRALQAVIDRHDILRTSVAWEGLPEPVQVVWRQAPLTVEEVVLDLATGDVAQQLRDRFDPSRYRLDLREAPLMRLFVARDAVNDRWLALELMHHLACDHTTLEVIGQEVQAHLLGQENRLPAPLPFREFVAQARLGVSQEEHEAFFARMLGDVDEPTAPFGLVEVQGEEQAVGESRRAVDPSLCRRLRARARALGVSAAALHHLAYALVLARVSARDDVVFGTVLFGRMDGGEEAERVVGMCINTLPLRIRFGGESVQAVARSTHDLLTKLLRHEHAPLALAQRCSAVKAPAPLFTALLNYRHSGHAGEEGGAAEAERAWEGMTFLESRERNNYPFALAVDDLGEDFQLTVRVHASLDPDRICAFIHTALEELVTALESRPTAPAPSLDVLPAAERHQLLKEWNQSGADYPCQACVHELFEGQAARAPERIAVVSEEQRITYGDLNKRANRLARHLRSLGVRPDARVAICAERSLEMVVGLLATLKAGGAYVPLDPAYPLERLCYMIEDTAPVALLTHAQVPEGVRAALSADALPVLDLESDAARWAEEPDADLSPREVGVTARHLAYVIYTSGSTGRPKGVMVEHRSVINHLEWRRVVCGLDADDVVLQRTAISFDISGWELWAPLVHGARVALLPPEYQRDPAAIARTIVQQGISCTQFVPTLLRLVLAQQKEMKGAKWRCLFSGGEPLDRQLAHELDRRFPGVLFNVYGPTEATIDATVWKYSDEYSQSTIPLGRPIANTRIYILDQRLRPAPIGVPGEIYVGGAGVARGYLGRAELTAERFLPDPFDQVPGATMYKTGDLGRFLADGNIEFLGRNDRQVKIRGFRIELGEIEARLCEHPAVREAVVLARDDRPGDTRLVAYVTRASAPDQAGEPGTPAAPVDVESLRAHLTRVLPDHMVPAAYVQLDAIPVMPNGKLDRNALPAPEGDAYVRRRYEAPIGDVETALARIWAEVLKLDRVGRNDNFFELGGHSLLAVSVIERMRRANLPTDVRALFATPTLSALAGAVGSDREAAPVPPNLIPADCQAISPAMLPLVSLSQADVDRIVGTVPGGAANVQDIYPLAPLQEGILFHHLMPSGSDVYLTPMLFSCDTREHLDRYLHALQAVIDRHDFLRTAVLWEGLPEPVQVVWRRAPLRVEELRFDPSGGDVAAQLRAHLDPRRYRLDVRQAPMKRLFTAWDGVNQRYVVLEMNHHLVGDHTTWGFIQQEIEAHLLGRADELPPPLPFRNFVAQARLGVSHQEHVAFFRQMLSDVDEPTVPFGLTDVLGGGRRVVEAKRPVEPGLSKRIRAQARVLGVSAASLCHLAWAQVLARVSGRDDVVFGTILLGRMQGGEGADRVLGMFINTLPLRIRIGDEGVRESVRRTHGLLTELIRHEHAPLVLAQRCSAVQAPAPLFTALLNYRHSSGGSDRSDGDGGAPADDAWRGMEFLSGEGQSNYPLSLAVDDLGDGFGLTVKVDDSVEPARICELMQTALDSLVTALEDTPTAPVRSLEVLPAAERHRLLVEWNDTRVTYPQDLCIHELFEEQVAKNPEAVAVVFEDQTLRYGDLNAQANRLAHHLRRAGVKPDSPVAICVERSPEMMVGLLAILKAGGAYVPLDPSYPAQRLAYMLTHSESALLLTHSRVPADLRARLQEMGGGQPAFRSLDLVVDATLWANETDTNPNRVEVALGPRHLAYVIYTSGSTGQPKGVMNEHAGVVNRLLWMQDAYGLRAGEGVLQKTPFSFDVSVWELFWPLLAGATMVVARPEGHKDPKYLADLIQRQSVTTIHFVPPMLQAFLECEEAARCSSLARVICSGEALPAGLVRRFQKTLPHAKLHNLYGPTEAAVDVTAWDCSAAVTGDRVPIGRPIANTRMYILDRYGSPAPIGVIGEIYIGGRQVARGYLNRRELTAERFLDDPFSDQPQARMYRTGDLGRFLPDGNIDFLGRNDHQVKIRGFRIELAEIEARLIEHTGVHEAVVVARDDGSGDKRLVAYVTTTPLESSHATSSGLAHEQVQEWSEVYDKTYALPERRSDIGFNTVGWNSSYTRSPFPEHEMREWLQGALDRISALKPKRVVEIGCGTGMILFKTAPQCERYVGTDLSGAVIGQLTEQIASHDGLKERVRLVQAEALDFSRVPGAEYDTVIMNSVVQLFPSIQYLHDVIVRAIGLIGAEGNIFIGDVRHYKLGEPFQLSVQLQQLALDTPLCELASRVSQNVRAEAELLIDPEWFLALQEHYPRITHVEVMPKEGEYTNEMSAYRYDVVMKIGGRPRYASDVLWLDYRECGATWDEVQARIQDAPAQAIGLKSIPNPRVQRDCTALKLLNDGDGLKTVEDVRARTAGDPNGGASCAEVSSFCAAQGYTAHFSWVPNATEGEYHAFILKKQQPVVVDWRGLVSPETLRRDHATYANDPLLAKRAAALPEQLRRHLGATLPDYMVPSDYVVLDALPLSPNGKLNRQALPAPDAALSRARHYETPVGELEGLLARVWAEVLKVDRIGRTDNFFELGGHSLLVLRVTSMLKRSNVEISMTDVFTYPTIETLAGYLGKNVPRPARRGAVAVRTSGSERPLFLVHELHGVDAYFPVLAAHLDGDFPVYGLTAVPLEQPQLGTMEELAVRLADVIQEVQPKGCYRLAGWSFGGALAYEIAAQLLARDQSVEFLGLLDTSNPTALRLQNQFTSPAKALLRQCERDPLLDAEQQRAIAKLNEAAGATDFGTLLDRCRRSVWLPEHLSGLTDPEVYGYCARLVAHTQAWESYRPRPLSVVVHLFVAQEATEVQAKTAPPLGWGTVVSAERIRVIPVPGDHHSMMDQPHIAALGGAMTRAIAQVGAEEAERESCPASAERARAW